MNQAWLNFLNSLIECFPELKSEIKGPRDCVPDKISDILGTSDPRFWKKYPWIDNQLLTDAEILADLCQEMKGPEIFLLHDAAFAENRGPLTIRRDPLPKQLAPGLIDGGDLILLSPADDLLVIYHHEGVQISITSHRRKGTSPTG